MGLKSAAGGRNGEREELIYRARWALLPDFTEHRGSKIFV